MSIRPLFAALAVLALGIVIAVASVTYRLIERPGMDLGKKVLQRIARAPALAEPVAITVPAKD